MRRGSGGDAEKALLEAKLGFLRAASEYRPMGFVSQRPLVSVGAAFLAGAMLGRPFRRRSPVTAYAPAPFPLGSLLSLVSTLIPIFFSRANSSGG